MTPSKLALRDAPELVAAGMASLPAVIVEAGPDAVRAFLEYFCATIRNRNTRVAYARQVWRFLEWCDQRGLELHRIQPMAVAGYIEQFPGSRPSAKQALAAIRKCFDYLVVNHVVRTSPALSVAGPKHSVKRGKTPVLAQEELHELLEAIDTSTVGGLRDRALLGIMYYSFGRVGAVVAMRREDYYREGKRWMFLLHEKGGKEHHVPAHHKAQEHLDEYLHAVGQVENKAPLFPTLTRRGELSGRPMNRGDVLRMVKRHARRAGLSHKVSSHSFRATGITEYMKAGGSVEGAQRIANHADARTTKLYDHSGDDVSLDEIERIPSV